MRATTSVPGKDTGWLRLSGPKEGHVDKNPDVQRYVCDSICLVLGSNTLSLMWGPYLV